LKVCHYLHNIHRKDEVGEKAYHLSEMIQAGFPIPPGFVIERNAFFYRNIDVIKEEVADHLLQISSSNGYMVRSSAIGEDGDETSFAGQLDSFIVTNELEDILHHIEKCWESYYNNRVTVYQEVKGKNLAGMGVIVQELISPDYAGVLFSKSYLTEGKMLGEYVQGHGEKLVSGTVNPEQFLINISDHKVDAVLPFESKTLIKHMVALEKHFGYPVDVEWVVKDGQTHIVQCRPITVATVASITHWSNTNVNENYPDPISPLLYSIARDSYYHYFKNLSNLLQIPVHKTQQLEGQYTNVIGVWGAKMYYNMSSIHKIISASPFSKFLIKSFDNFVGYQEETKATQQKSTLKDTWSFIKSFFLLHRRLTRYVLDFEERANAYQEAVDSAFTHTELKNAFHQFIEIRMHSWYKASLADFFAMIYHGLLGKLCVRYYGDSSERVRNELIQAIPGLISSKPIQETWRISEMTRANDTWMKLLEKHSATKIWNTLMNDQSYHALRKEIEKYLRNWGFRCSGELMFTKDNYCEAPHKYIELLQGYLKHTQRNPEELIHEKHLESLKTYRAVKRKIYARRRIFFPIAWIESRIFSFVVGQTIKGISSRERVRLKQALLYYQYKKVVLRIAKMQKEQFEVADDIFYMKYQEIQELLSASEMLPIQRKRAIELRKQEFKEQSILSYPDDFATNQGTYPMPDAVIVPLEYVSENGLTGLTACGGYIKGRARVLDSVLEAEKLEKGDILVTRQTDPGWASIFPLISGLVVERGGMLSHGAIVAREFGIPAVVGVRDATERIVDGSIIEIKADTGEIIIHE